MNQKRGFKQRWDESEWEMIKRIHPQRECYISLIDKAAACTHESDCFPHLGPHSGIIMRMFVTVLMQIVHVQYDRGAT